MFSLFKRLFAVAEVDGVTFWSKKAFDEYMLGKHREENGLKRYTFRVVGNGELSEAMSILEGSGIFDYSRERDWLYGNVFDIHYWSDQKVLTRKSASSKEAE